MTKSMLRKALWGCMAAVAALLLLPCVAFAGTVQPGNSNDRAVIQAELDETGNVTLVKGATYYLNGNLYLKSGSTINAEGATIVSVQGALRNSPDRANYSAMKNVVINGGTWKSSDANYDKTMFYFAHGQNITVKNVTIEGNYAGHLIEIIACKDVVIDNCQLVESKGKVNKTSVEEAVQIDIAASRTSPTLAGLGKPELVKGQTCQNITIKNCLVRGGRGVCSNYAASDSDKAYRGNYHKNIVLENNTIVGMSAEGVALFNVAGATVKNNVIVSNSSRVNDSYSVGLHFHIFGNGKVGAYSNAVYNVQGNKILGSRQGLYFYSHTSSQFGTVNVKNNSCGSYNSKDAAIVVKKTNTVRESGNSTYKWDGSFNTNIAGSKPGYHAASKPSAKGGWKSDSKGWWYQNADGSYAKSGWKRIDGAWYHFTGSGYMSTGWVKDGKTWYYCDKKSGAMKTGWVRDGKSWYYLSGSGAMKTGWLKDGKSWYYLNGAGVMQTGWTKVGKAWYYLNGSGVMQANKWIGDYYVQADGSMAVNKKIGAYRVGADGRWVR